jgi:mRNA (guanine-N7-)-methyltransferase
MPYPKDNPQSKHDICCPTALNESLQDSANGSTIINTLDALTSNLLKSSVQQEPVVPPRLATVYTYKDAPVKPKPLSGKLRIDNLMTFALFQRVTHTDNGTDGLLKKCTTAVKVPSVIEQYAHDQRKYQADMRNSKSFKSFFHQLQTKKQVAALAYDSAGRIGFLVPFALLNPDGIDDDEEYAACLYYAPMKEFISFAKKNYAKSEQLREQQELETWTPQYTPPPESECGPSSEWDDFHPSREEITTWTPQYTPPPESACEPSSDWDHIDSNNKNKTSTNEAPLFLPPDSSDVPLFQPPTTSDEAPLFQPPGSEENLFMPPGETDFSDSGYRVSGYGVLDQDDNGGWDNADTNNATMSNSTGIGGWSQVDNQESSNMKEGVFHANEGAAAADAFYSGLTRSLDTRADSRLYHMRAFNGWVKATQIAELDPDTSKMSMGKKRSRRSPLRVLDLACGKGECVYL